MNMQTTMTDESTISSGADSAREGNCLLLTLNERQILVPRNLVAEVMRYSFLKFETDKRSGLQVFEWRGHQVPHLSGDMFGDKAEVIINEDTKVAILHGLKYQKQLPFYSFTLSRSPRLLRVSEADLKEIKGVELHPGELMQVSLENSTAFIPKVDHFENIISDMMKQRNNG